MSNQIAPPPPITRKAHRSARFNPWSAAPFVVFLVVYALLPRWLQERHLVTLIYIGINVLLAVGLNLVMGYAGQISLGHAAFFGIGAYISAILTVKPIPAEITPEISMGVGIMAGCAVLISLTRVTGARLAAGIGALLVMAWIVGAAHSNAALAFVIFACGMGAYGVAVKIGWWKTGLAGLVTALVDVISQRFLTRVLAVGSASPWTAMLVGMLLTGLIAYLVGGQVLRLRGHYLAMGTLAFGIIVEIVFKQWTAVTGGSSDGIFGIPTINFMVSIPSPARAIFRMAAGGQIGMKQDYYYLVWGFVFIALVLAANIVRSRVGRAFRAVHGSQAAAESLGVDTERYKVQVFVLSAGLASIAGSLYAHNVGVGYINPSEFDFTVSIMLVVMVVVGGTASIWGSLLGAGAIQLLKDYLLTIEKAQPQLMGLSINGLDPIVFGAVLIAVMILLPQGLARGLTDMASASWRIVTRAGRKRVGE